MPTSSRARMQSDQPRSPSFDASSTMRRTAEKTPSKTSPKHGVYTTAPLVEKGRRPFLPPEWCSRPPCMTSGRLGITIETGLPFSRARKGTTVRASRHAGQQGRLGAWIAPTILSAPWATAAAGQTAATDHWRSGDKPGGPQLVPVPSTLSPSPTLMKELPSVGLDLSTPRKKESVCMSDLPEPISLAARGLDPPGRFDSSS
ncbi:hypothetical protein PtB15_3B202 [Puccinia triticina]|nr:hypothetical protein PtB15_3B202 [Puccinia triticina]